ncbi:MAG: hypothetical protein O3A14_11975 [Cyanobacteria bacterium]|nr:hypothetical protein [Cyanobacteriota bacterium]
MSNPKSRPFTLRIFGVIGVIGCLFTLVTGFQQRRFAQFPLILLFWLPGSLYLTFSDRTNP